LNCYEFLLWSGYIEESNCELFKDIMYR